MNKNLCIDLKSRKCVLLVQNILQWLEGDIIYMAEKSKEAINYGTYVGQKQK